ncbi:sensor histidine kinase [Alteromonas oceanisediminis]|uniref:sensor histidine kinase n=1 Tax=Alteromonas oceanisediminis TaxID=2836180 RepID=UPI001BDA0352|nr:GAF domain-containing sensor histidine kinase [Alteromonas oceanisediminis]MBT0585499.1 GAF domain-containing sensor histidine kinase [Alteromonas oceanisediminis]
MRLKLIDNSAADKFAKLKNRSVIEQGRANALDLLLSGGSLEDVATAMLEGVELADTSMRCAVLLANDDGLTLTPLVAPSLPASFIKALQRHPISESGGSCGAAVYHRKAVFVDDVYSHPNWEALRADARKAGIHSAWSHPLVSPDGKLYGTLAAYFTHAKAPTSEDTDALEYEAKILSIIIERAENIAALKQANADLEQKVSERTRDLSQSNALLSKALDQRNEVRLQLLEMENMAALGTMMSSLTHEINTPIGVAITASTYLKAMQQKSETLFKKNGLRRSDLEAFYQECAEASDIIERNLNRTSQLIRTFKQLSTDQHSQQARPVNLCGYIDEVLLSLKPRLKRIGHVFCIDVNANLEIQSNPGALSQILINLIMNSTNHGFEPGERGQITIRARVENDAQTQQHLVLEYSDNGKGMTEHTVANIYKPFFTNARHNGGTGLGMHICYNLAVEALQGSIDCVSSLGKGTKFTLRFPI